MPEFGLTYTVFPDLCSRIRSPPGTLPRGRIVLSKSPDARLSLPIPNTVSIHAASGDILDLADRRQKIDNLAASWTRLKISTQTEGPKSANFLCQQFVTGAISDVRRDGHQEVNLQEHCGMVCNHGQ
ncbi:hypothetical protein BDW66DRAFT_129917 [Aspergillus desertorum]